MIKREIFEFRGLEGALERERDWVFEAYKERYWGLLGI